MLNWRRWGNLTDISFICLFPNLGIYNTIDGGWRSRWHQSTDIPQIFIYHCQSDNFSAEFCRFSVLSLFKHIIYILNYRMSTPHSYIQEVYGFGFLSVIIKYLKMSCFFHSSTMKLQPIEWIIVMKSHLIWTLNHSNGRVQSNRIKIHPYSIGLWVHILLFTFATVWSFEWLNKSNPQQLHNEFVKGDDMLWFQGNIHTISPFVCFFFQIWKQQRKAKIRWLTSSSFQYLF